MCQPIRSFPSYESELERVHILASSGERGARSDIEVCQSTRSYPGDEFEFCLSTRSFPRSRFELDQSTRNLAESDSEFCQSTRSLAQRESAFCQSTRSPPGSESLLRHSEKYLDIEISTAVGSSESLAF